MERNIYKTNIRDCENEIVLIEEWENGEFRLVVKGEYEDNLIDIYIDDIIEWVIKFKPNYMKEILKKENITSSFSSSSNSQNQPNVHKVKDQGNRDSSYNRDHLQATLIEPESLAHEYPHDQKSSESVSTTSPFLRLFGWN